MERIYGAIFGALVGDAAGATLEFYRDDITTEIVNKAIQMPGGGVFHVGPGQFTDDGELTLSLLYALGPTFDIEKIAKGYIEWYQSDPFDMGMTCANAFSSAYDATSMMENALHFNIKKESNGSLMRNSIERI